MPVSSFRPSAPMSFTTMANGVRRYLCLTSTWLGSRILCSSRALDCPTFDPLVLLISLLACIFSLQVYGLQSRKKVPKSSSVTDPALCSPFSFISIRARPCWISTWTSQACAQSTSKEQHNEYCDRNRKSFPMKRGNKIPLHLKWYRKGLFEF